jgi:hypothetical protein
MTTAGSVQLVEAAAVARMLLTRREAAAALGMSLRHFQRHVQPFVPCVYSGQLRLYRPRDLERWAEHENEQGGLGRRGASRTRHENAVPRRVRSPSGVVQGERGSRAGSVQLHAELLRRRVGSGGSQAA